MAGNLIQPTSSKTPTNLRVDTFEFTTVVDLQVLEKYTLNLENGSHLSLSLKYQNVYTYCGCGKYDFELTVGYNNFLPNKTIVRMKSTDGSRIGSILIIPPKTVAQLGLIDVYVLGTKFNWIIEVTYLLPDVDQPIKKSPLTIAMDYEAKAEALQDLSNFSVICKGKTFLCHKVVLAARSDSLARLIKNTKNDKVDMKDFAHEVVEKMITFMYTDKLPKELSIEDTEELFKIADKYQVESLRQTCEIILLKDLDMGNALRRLHFAKKYKAEKLLKKSLKIVKDDIGTLAFAKEFSILMADFPDILEDRNM